MASTGGNVQVSDAVFELDDLKGSGGVVVTFGVPLSIVTHVEIDTLDLDSFLAPAGRRPEAGSALPAAPAAASAQAGVAGPSIGLKVKVARLDLPEGDDRRRRGRRRPAGQHARA